MKELTHHELKKMTLYSNDGAMEINGNSTYFFISAHKINFWGNCPFGMGPKYSLKTVYGQIALKLDYTKQCGKSDFEASMSVVDQKINLLECYEWGELLL